MHSIKHPHTKNASQQLPMGSHPPDMNPPEQVPPHPPRTPPRLALQHATHLIAARLQTPPKPNRPSSPLLLRRPLLPGALWGWRPRKASQLTRPVSPRATRRRHPLRPTTPRRHPRPTSWVTPMCSTWPTPCRPTPLTTTTLHPTTTSRRPLAARGWWGWVTAATTTSPLPLHLPGSSRHAWRPWWRLTRLPPLPLPRLPQAWTAWVGPCRRSSQLPHVVTTLGGRVGALRGWRHTPWPRRARRVGQRHATRQVRQPPWRQGAKGQRIRQQVHGLGGREGRHRPRLLTTGPLRRLLSTSWCRAAAVIAAPTSTCCCGAAAAAGMRRDQHSHGARARGACSCCQ
jgi:hypothetical protein